MQILTKKQIKDSKDVTVTPVHIPEWGGAINIRKLTISDFAVLEDLANQVKKAEAEGRKQDVQDMVAKYLMLAAVDEKGDKLFSDDDLAWLREKNGDVMLRLFQFIRRDSGLDEKERSDMRKNSEGKTGGFSSG
jgi:hypothetical protein